MSRSAGPPQSASVRTGWVTALGVVLVVVAGCGAQDQAGRAPEQRVQQPGTGNSVGPRGCVDRVDTLIDSRTIPRADRDYAIGMCLDNR